MAVVDCLRDVLYVPNPKFKLVVCMVGAVGAALGRREGKDDTQQRQCNEVLHDCANETGIMLENER